MPPRKRAPTHAIVVVIDPPDILGLPGVPADEASIGRVVSALTQTFPEFPVRVVRTRSDAPALTTSSCLPGRGVLEVQSAFHTDVARLAELHADRVGRVVVVRAATAALPLLSDAVAAAESAADLLTIDGAPPDGPYVVSGRTIALLAPLGAIPGARTIPDAVRRLAAASATRDLPLRVVSWSAGAGTTAARTTDTRVAAPGGAAASGPRGVGEARPAAVTVADGTPSRPVLVVLPSRYQTGAHFAWMAVAGALDPSDVAFLVARDTLLATHLRSRGFVTLEIDPGSQAAQAPVRGWDAVLDAVRPSIVHVDGAECVPYMHDARRRGVRVVQHVRLAVVDRFAPGFAAADVIAAVSPHLQREIAARVGDRRVEYLPDGVPIPDAAAVAWPPAAPRPLRCLCVGRVEPAKDTLRVVAIVRALSALIACELQVLGPCGNDPAYADEVVTQLRALPDRARGTWRPFSYPLTDAYSWADVVLVASRSEALGMVGIEALAAGRLLVAQRSTGYETIVDPAAGEGLLFERDESADAIAARLFEALAAYREISAAARSKARRHFEAGTTAARLREVWASLR